MAPWMMIFPDLSPIFLAYRQVGGRDRTLELRHPYNLRVPIAIGTPTTVWHWCLMHGLPCLKGKHRLARMTRQRTWLGEFQARYGKDRPWEMPFHSSQTDH